MRRSLLDGLSSNTSERLAQAPLLQKPIIELEQLDCTLAVSERARVPQITLSRPCTVTLSDEASSRGHQSAASPGPMPQLGNGEPLETRRPSQLRGYHQDLQDRNPRTHLSLLERQKRELALRRDELHDRAGESNHLAISIPQRDAALSRKEASLDERERRLMARESLVQRHRLELRGVTRKHRDEAESVFQRHTSEMEEVVQRQESEMDDIMYE